MQETFLVLLIIQETHQHLLQLENIVSEALSHHFLDVDIETAVSNGRLLAFLAKNGEVLSRTYTEDRVSVHCRLPRKFAGRISPSEATVKVRENGRVSSSEIASGQPPLDSDVA